MSRHSVLFVAGQEGITLQHADVALSEFRDALLDNSSTNRLRQRGALCDQAAGQLPVPADGRRFSFVQSQALFYEEFERNDIGIAEIVIVPCLAMLTHRSMIALRLGCSVRQSIDKKGCWL